LSLGLSPFVETLPAAGEAGSAVAILGTNLTSASSVTLNGTTAAFTVESASEIITLVPAAAATGFVQVTILGATLLSNVAFNVPASSHACAVNEAGNYNMTDVQLIINEALGLSPAANDLNGDGVLNVIDVQMSTNTAPGGGCPAV
jgi:hypothetical protein